MIYGMIAASGYIVCNVSTTANRTIMATYKISEDKWFTDESKIVLSFGQYATPEYEGKIYFHNASNSKLSYFDTNTEEVGVTEYTSSTIRGGKFIKFDDPSLPGVTLVTVQANGAITYNNFGSKTYTDVMTESNPQPVQVRNLERGLKGTNTIAISSYMGPKLGILNDMTNEITYLAHGQIEGMGEAHGEFYTGGYPGAILSTIDFNNYTRNIFAKISSDKQDRPFVVIEAGEYVAVSSVADYGILSGAITLVNPKTKETEVFANIIKNQSIIGMAYKDGKIYGSTGIWGGLGIDPSESEAKLFIFDLKTKKVVKEAVPKLKNMKTPVMFIGDVSFGGNGTLWANSGGTLFEIDPETLAVKQEILIKNHEWKVASPRYSPHYIRWLSDTVMVTSAGDYLSVVDVTTSEFKTLVSRDITYMALSENNNIYYLSPERTKLYKRAINFQNDAKQYMGKVSQRSAPKGYERVPYKNFGFSDSSFMTEKELKQGTAVLSDVTFSGVSNSNKQMGTIRYGKSGIYNDLNLNLFPQSVSLETFRGKHAIKIAMPAKGLQTILALPIVEFNSTYPNDGVYKFIADIYVTPAQEVTTPDKIDLKSDPAKVNGKPQLGAYVTFMDSSGKRVGDTSRLYIEPSDSWQTLSIDVTGIPDQAVSMVAYLYGAGGNATAGTYIANPAFYKYGNPEYKEASINESVILYLNNPTAYVNLFRFYVDKNNKNVMPFTRDSRTLVPVRFVSEAINAKVGWDDATQTVTITKGESVVKIKIGETEMDINGAKTKLDVGAIVENGRTYLPLRAVAEALNKTVFWDDRGLIVISEGELLSADFDKELINTIISYFKQGDSK